MRLMQKLDTSATGGESPMKFPPRRSPLESFPPNQFQLSLACTFFGDTRNRARCASYNGSVIRLSRRLSRALLEIFREGWFMGQASTSPLVDSPRVREAYILILVTPWAASLRERRVCRHSRTDRPTPTPLKPFRVEEIWYVKGGITLQLKIIICYLFDIRLKT